MHASSLAHGTPPPPHPRIADPPGSVIGSYIRGIHHRCLRTYHSILSRVFVAECTSKREERQRERESIVNTTRGFVRSSLNLYDELELKSELLINKRSSLS